MHTFKHKPLPDTVRTPVLEALYAALNPTGETTRIVGGAVRDWLAGKSLGDIDLATTLLPEQSKKRAQAAGFKVIPTGLAHGTVMAVKDGEHYEITTLRRDIETDGRHAKVLFTRDFAEDALRRDFTFNALYMDLDGNVTDHTNGIDDLMHGRVRFVGNPAERLAEDYLRLLRYFRFWARFGCEIPDEETTTALKNATVGINRLSPERITEELLKLLKTDRAVEALDLMRQHQVLDALDLGHMDLPALTRYRQQVAKPAPLACLQAAMWHVSDRQPLADNPHFVFSNADKSWLRLTARSRLRDVYLHNLPLSVDLLGNDHALVDLTNLAKANGFIAEIANVNELPRFPITGKDLMRQGAAAGKSLGIHLRRLKSWWLSHDCPDAATTLAAGEALQKQAPGHLLVVPDTHGEIALLQRLQASELWQQASCIIFLGDYLDGDHVGGYIETARWIEQMVKTDSRVVLLRANHEQVNDRQFKQALANPDMPLAESIVHNRHNRQMLDEMATLSQSEMLTFMQTCRHVYRDYAVDAARLKLPDGKVYLFTHAGYHPALLQPQKLTARDAAGIELELIQLPHEAKNPVFWGQALAAPDDQLPDAFRHLFAPPQGVEIVVGHHFSRRKNLLPEHQGNITFMDTGAGKGGRLSLVAINPHTGARTYFTDEQSGFVAVKVPHRPQIVAHPRNLPKVILDLLAQQKK